jgi:SAM-dependent methyltransferase
MFRDAWIDSIPPQYALNSTSVSVDLGCGRFPRNPLGAGRLIGIDIVDATPGPKNEEFEYVQVSPGDPIRLESSSVECVSAFDFLEHVPRFDRNAKGDALNPFIEIMNEVHRILKPGGLFIALTPCFPSPAAFGDPTHINFISEGTYEYFAKHNFAKTLGYGFIGEFAGEPQSHKAQQGQETS